MRKNIFILLYTIYSLSALAQPGGNPFSASVLGELNNNANPTQNVIGGDAANQDSTYLNYSNPASYSSLTLGQPLFSTSLGTRISKFSENNINLNFRSTQIDHLAFGLSFGKRFGAAIGFTQFATKNYEINDFQIAGTDTVYEKYKGLGGVNSVFGGLSYKVFNIKGYKLNLGIQGDFLFGDLTDERFSSPKSNVSFGGYASSQYRIKDVIGKFGLQFSKAFKNHRFELGAIYTPSSKVTTYKTDSLYYTPQFGIVNPIGKIVLDGSSVKGNLAFPATTSFGLIYHYEPKVDSNFTSKYLYRLSFLFNYETTSWSTVRENFGSISNVLALRNSDRLNIGFEFTPHRNALDKIKSVNYLAKVRYRVGFQNGNLSQTIGGKQVKDQSFNFGFGFPIPSQRSISNVNVGFRYGVRGNGVTNQLNEKYWTINFGILLAPGKNDKWFRKYLYD